MNRNELYLWRIFRLFALLGITPLCVRSDSKVKLVLAALYILTLAVFLAEMPHSVLNCVFLLLDVTADGLLVCAFIVVRRECRRQFFQLLNELDDLSEVGGPIEYLLIRWLSFSM